MTLLHADNFSLYGDNEAFLLNGIYAQNVESTLENDPDGVSGGKVLLLPPAFGGGGAYGLLRFALPATTLTCGQGCRMWLASLPSTADMAPCPISFKNGSNNFLFNVVITSTGRIEVRQGGFYGTVIGSTTNPVVSANGWYHIEAKLVVDAANGSIEVRVEGATVISQTGINTGSTAVAQVEICNDPTGTSAGVSMYVKDYTIWNGSGSLNNNFLGTVIVSTLTPTADAALNWTPSTGTTGYTILDNIPPVDAQYIAAGDPAPSPYVCEMSNLSPDVTSVKAIVTYVRASKSDGGDGNLQVGIISDPTGTPATALGADRAITAAQTYWCDVFETDPKTSAAWLPSAVNLAHLQLDRTV